MTLRGAERKEKILQVAEEIILQKGFAATSIDDILQQAHITKGGFFYHFKGRDELAKGLLERYLVEDRLFFQGLIERAQQLSEDPLQQLLVFLNLLAEAMGDLPGVHPGCLIVSFTYESQQFNEDVQALLAESTLEWRDIFRELLKNALQAHPMKIDVPLDELADSLSSTIEGGIILSKVLSDQQTLVQQIRQYRNYIRLLFNDVSPQISEP
tara:strand:+ start:28330 stop:28965 length:636 start_codon:yes stop_codon:yes gene_type:complete